MYTQEQCYLSSSGQAVANMFIAQGLDADLAIEMALRVLGEDAFDRPDAP